MSSSSSRAHGVHPEPVRNRTDGAFPSVHDTDRKSTGNEGSTASATPTIAPRRRLAASVSGGPRATTGVGIIARKAASDDVMAAARKEGKRAIGRPNVASPSIKSTSADNPAAMGSSTPWRLELVRAVNVAIGADRTMPEAYRTRFERRPARVRDDDHAVTVEFPRFSPKRGRYPSTITLSGNLPWVIGATGQLSALTADLGGLELRELDFRGGASRILMLLPRPAGQVPIRFAGGVADVTI